MTARATFTKAEVRRAVEGAKAAGFDVTEIIFQDGGFRLVKKRPDSKDADKPESAPDPW